MGKGITTFGSNEEINCGKIRGTDRSFDGTRHTMSDHLRCRISRGRINSVPLYFKIQISKNTNISKIILYKYNRHVINGKYHTRMCLFIVDPKFSSILNAFAEQDWHKSATIVNNFLEMLVIVLR